MKLRLPAPQSGAALEQLGPSQGHDVDRQAAAPVEQVVDEVEQAGVGEVHVLEDERHRAWSAMRSKNVRQAPNSWSAAMPDVEPEQGQQRALDPVALVRVGDPLCDRRR